MRKKSISKFLEWGALILILIACFCLSFSVSLQESAIMDELAHIPAGYGYVRYLDYRLNPEHPPLLKALAALPLLFEGLNFPTQSQAWQKDVNGQWEAGTLFLYQSGNDADKIIGWARLAPILITLLLVLLIYIWARELMGRWWALLPAFLFALSPNILAHSHYVTTDVAAAFGIFLALYYFVKYLMDHSKKRLIYAGAAFGIAQLLKFSSVLLIPFFIFIAMVFYLWKWRSETRGASFLPKLAQLGKQFIKALGVIVLTFFIGYILVYILYFAFTLNYPIEKQVADTKLILTSFAGGPDVGLQSCGLSSKVPLSRRMRCLADVDVAMAGNPALRPLAQYMLGVLMVLQRSSGGNTAYFLGEVSAAGWWYYFPIVFVLKEPIPSLILIAISLVLAVWGIIKKFKIQNSKFKIFSDYLGTNFAEFSMLSFVIFYWLYSIKSPLNIGVRHIFPTIPFIYILTAGTIKKWLTRDRLVLGGGFLKTLAKATFVFLKSSSKGILLVILIAWYSLETILAYPNFISYFNEFAGGTESGYRYVTDSNYDWGQDLKRLAEYVKQNHTNKIAVDYFGGGNPKYYMGDNVVEYWSSSKGNPASENIHWLAVSVNTLQSAKGKLHPGQERNPEAEYSWLPNPYTPYARAGTSIFIYKL